MLKQKKVCTTNPTITFSVTETEEEYRRTENNASFQKRSLDLASREQNKIQVNGFWTIGLIRPKNN